MSLWLIVLPLGNLWLVLGLLRLFRLVLLLLQMRLLHWLLLLLRDLWLLDRSSIDIVVGLDLRLLGLRLLGLSHWFLLLSPLLAPLLLLLLLRRLHKRYGLLRRGLHWLKFSCWLHWFLLLGLQRLLELWLLGSTSGLFLLLLLGPLLGLLLLIVLLASGNTHHWLLLGRLLLRLHWHLRSDLRLRLLTLLPLSLLLLLSHLRIVVEHGSLSLHWLLHWHWHLSLSHWLLLLSPLFAPLLLLWLFLGHRLLGHGLLSLACIRLLGTVRLLLLHLGLLLLVGHFSGVLTVHEFSLLFTKHLVLWAILVVKFLIVVVFIIVFIFHAVVLEIWGDIIHFQGFSWLTHRSPSSSPHARGEGWLSLGLRWDSWLSRAHLRCTTVR